jgi:hypothetical protein
MMSRIALALALAFSLHAQAPREASPDHFAAMKKLSFLVGEWQGESWTQMGPDKRTSKGTEIVQSKLGGLLLVIDGRFESGGQVAHNAYGVLSYDPRAERYRFNAYTANGQMADAKVELKEGGFDWSFQPNPGITIRYEMRLNDTGEWVEKGYFVRDGSPVQFFEMHLKKK